MSEWQALYFTKDTLMITDFIKVYVGDEDVTSIIDKLQVTMIDDGFSVSAYKENNFVKIIPEGIKIKNIMLDKGYIGFSGGTTYKIEI